MIFHNVLTDIDECRKQIEKDFKIDLTVNTSQISVLLRGENFPFESTEPSMRRFLTKDGKTMEGFYYLSPFLDFYDIYSEFHAGEYWLSEAESEGFLQHYGFPTDIFDFTSSFEVAKFFALYEQNNLHIDGNIGTIGVVNKNDLSNYYRVFPLCDHPIALRPKNQFGFGVKHERGIFNLKSPECDRFFNIRWYRFYKSNHDIKFINAMKSIIYPSEQELTYFFSDDLENFLRNHQSFNLMDSEQKLLLLERLERIKKQDL